MKKIITVTLMILFLGGTSVASAFSLFTSNNKSTTSEAQPIDTADVQGSNQQDKTARQIEYFQQLNIPQKFEQMQQEIQELRGLIDLQRQQLKQLETQQRSLYSDLDARITQLTSGGFVLKNKTTVPATTSSANSAELDKQIKTYQDAFDLIKQKKYSKAITGLKGYLQKYPSGTYAANSYYWLGEMYAKAGDNDLAAKEFNTVVTSYADSNKTPDALLRLGSIAFDQSQWSQARKSWEKLVSQHPDTAAARIAETNLKDLAKQGN